MSIRRFNSAGEFLAQLQRSREVSPELVETVRDIIATVRKEGDEALTEYTRRFDGVGRDSLAVTAEEWTESSGVDQETKDLLAEAASNIRRFHEQEFSRLESWRIEEEGATVGQQLVPLQRVGVYVPGGTAAYPSSVLMNVIPAQVAGVEEIAIVTPPVGETGYINPMVLAAAEQLGIGEIYGVGGAQAVAALAYGTESIRRVQMISGPGNKFVNEAKRQVFGQVGIDSLAGPSEILILADVTADPALLAADLLSQAEHDADARAVLISPEKQVLDATAAELGEQLETLPRREIAEESLRTGGGLILVGDLNEGIALTNEIAPEHLELQVRDPEETLKKIRAAGAAFLGKYTPEPVGDYWAGSNHILPTGGSARYASALSVHDFVRWTSTVYYTEARLQKDGAKVSRFARLEGLEAHARAVDLRLKGKAGTGK